MAVQPQVASHPQWPVTKVTDTGRSTKYRHKTLGTVTKPQLVFANVWTKAIVVKASIQTTGGTRYPVHFTGENGEREVEIPAQTIVESLPVEESLSLEGIFYTNTLVKPSEVGGSYHTGTSLGSVQNNIAEGSASKQACILGTTDYTVSENPGTAGSLTGYGPLRIAGETTFTPMSEFWGVIGDSYTLGVGDNTQATGLVIFETGFSARWLSGKFPYVSVGVNGEGGKLFAGAAEIVRRAALSNTTHILWEYITNDLAGGFTNAEIRPKFVEAWYQLSEGSKKVHAVTCPPRTSSTDSWATTANQTAISAKFGPEEPESERQKYNKWMRDGAPINTETKLAVTTGEEGAKIARCRVFGLEGALLKAASGPAGHPLRAVFDEAALFETYNEAKSTWVWKTAYATDGVHPKQAGHEALATQIAKSAEAAATEDAASGGGGSRSLMGVGR